MSFTWKFTKPVSSSTLTSTTPPSYEGQTANSYSFPTGATNPTSDVLKAQLDEMRKNLDTLKDYIDYCSAKQSGTADVIECNAQRYRYASGGVACSSQCSTAYLTQYTSRYTTQYLTRYGTQYETVRSGAYASDWLCSTYFSPHNQSVGDCGAVHSTAGAYNATYRSAVKNDYCMSNKTSYCPNKYHTD